MPRHVSSRVLCAVSAFALIAAVAPRASAQETRVVVAGGSNFALRGGQLPITDAAVADLVARHFPEILHGDQAYHITLVVDANGQYVSGKTAKATVMTRAALDTGAFVIRDSVAGATATAMVRRLADATGAGAAAGSAGVVIARSTTGEPHMVGGVFGTEYSLADIGQMGMKKYDAGELGDALIMVTVVKLKP